LHDLELRHHLAKFRHELLLEPRVAQADNTAAKSQEEAMRLIYEDIKPKKQITTPIEELKGEPWVLNVIKALEKKHSN
jgi:hypothetical protein